MLLAKSGGIRLERKKESTLLNALKRPFLVRKIRVPLLTGEGTRPIPCVRPGDTVERGDRIASSEDGNGVPVFSGIAGKVGDIGERTLPDNSSCLCIDIVLENDFRQAPPRFTEVQKDAETLGRREILKVFRDCGLKTTGSESVPLHLKFSETEKNPRTLVINGCEPEPYVTAEQALLTHHLMEVLKGAEVLRKAAGAEGVILLIEDSERELFEFVKSKVYFLKWDAFKVKKVPAVYPMGFDDFLPGECSLDSVVLKPSTAFAAFEAVYFLKPFFERVVTVGGECVVEPRNLWLPMGLAFQDAVQLCKGLLREPGKLLAGGPMKGIAQANGEVPLVPGTDAVLALPKEIVCQQHEEPCLRCNRCVDVCPVFLSPVMITLAAGNGEFEAAKEWKADECIECGLCGFVCPSKRPMLELITLVKQKTGEQR